MVQHARRLLNPCPGATLHHAAILKHDPACAAENKCHGVIVVPMQLVLLCWRVVLDGMPSPSSNLGKGLFLCGEVPWVKVYSIAIS
jgi:hypothetical protein